MMIRQHDKPTDPLGFLYRPYRIWKQTTLNGSGFAYGTSIAMPVRATVSSPGYYIDAAFLIDEKRLAMVKKICFELCFGKLELQQVSAAVLVDLTRSTNAGRGFLLRRNGTAITMNHLLSRLI
jgi:hypothetical protein